jgi:hypothetical protein
MQPDPIGGSISSPQSLNRYAYTSNDPVNRVDPLGLQSIGPRPPGFSDDISVRIYYTGTYWPYWVPLWGDQSIGGGGGPTRPITPTPTDDPDPCKDKRTSPQFPNDTIAHIIAVHIENRTAD